MTLPTTLTGALVARFTDQIDTATVPNGPWVAEIPEDPTFPLVAILPGTERRDWATEGCWYDTGEVTFVVLAVGAANAEALATTIADLFNPAENWPLIAMQSRQLFQMLQVSYTLSATEQKVDGDTVFRVDLVFESRVGGKVGS